MLRLDIPGLGPRAVSAVISDYSGTLAHAGALSAGVRTRLAELAKHVDVHILTSDTFGTAAAELRDLPVTVHILTGEQHDEQKRTYAAGMDPEHLAAFGNGKNDRLLLELVRDAGGISVAVDNGEGCAIDAMMASHILIHGSQNALDLLLDPRRCVATLRY